jgi:hypothetical protein
MSPGRLIMGPDDLENMPDEIKEALGEALHDMLGKRAKKNRPLPEALMMDIEIASAAYKKTVNEGCQFGIGDWITPKKGYGLKHHGMPHRVVEVLTAPSYNFHKNDSNLQTYGRRNDIRVLTWVGGDITAFWNESWLYELYDPKNDYNE